MYTYDTNGLTVLFHVLGYLSWKFYGLWFACHWMYVYIKQELMRDELSRLAFTTMKTIIALACVFVAVSAQRGPFGRGPLDRLKPKCADDSKPTCVCGADGTTITR